MTYVMEMEGITKSFSDKKVLCGIDLKIEEGEIAGFLGPSGAGKTTLVKILTGQLKQTAGKAKLLGEDTLALSNAVYGKIGIMMDNCGLYERLSVWDNLKIFAGIFGVTVERMEYVLKHTRLYEAKKSPVEKLSKGMRSRLLLARAVLNEAKVLFLDEPTSGLDPGTACEIHNLLLEEKKKGTAVFLTTHNMAEAEKLCDHVALLHQGNIVEYGKPKEICKKYNRLNKLLVQLKTGEHLELPNNSTAAKQLAQYLENEMVETIHSTEPNLESIFLTLTGRGLEA